MSKKIISFLIAIVSGLLLSTWIAYGKSTIVMATIGDDPSAKIKTRQPFMDYLAENLHNAGIQKGKIIVVEDIYQVAELFNEGKADIFVDSPFPTVMLSHLASTKMLLRRWKKGVAEYYSVIFVRKDSGISTLDDLKGKMISFEDASSTSGYFLPKTVLLDYGLKLKEKKRMSSPVSPNEVGYTFSQGDETTMVWVLRNKVQAGAIDYPNFVEDAKGKEDELLILYQTEPVPRHIISYRHDLPSPLVKAVENTLLAMDQSEEGNTILQGYERTKKFDALPPQSTQVLNNMKRYVKLELEE